MTSDAHATRMVTRVSTHQTGWVTLPGFWRLSATAGSVASGR